MEYHKLLSKQIQKLLTKECLENPGINNFINAVNESYKSFERDKELMDHVFTQSEEEYQELLFSINREVAQKQKSINKLYISLRTLDENLETLKSEDLGELTEYFSKQIKKRKQVEDELNRQFEFQKLLMNVSTEYISIPFEEIGKGIKNSLKELAEYVNADRAHIFNYNVETGISSSAYEYCAEGISPQKEILQNLPVNTIPELLETINSGKSINIPKVSELENSKLKEIFTAQNIKSLLVVPMMQKGVCIGFVGFESIKKQYHYSKTEVELLSLFASVLANAQERLSMESNLARTIELLKTLLANLQYGILVEDENRKILFSNSLFCKMFNINVSPDDLVGIDCTNSAEETKNIFVKEKEFSEGINKLLKNRKMVTNELLETKDGRFLERDYIPIFINNKYSGNLWKYNDATKRVLTHNLLEQSERRNRLIMNSAINAIININSDGNITFWNKSAEEIFGWTREEILGRNISETILQNVNNSTTKNTSNNNKDISFNKQIELTAIRRNGEEFPIEASIIPIVQDGKKFFCYFIQDISVRKQSEINLKIQEEKYRNIIANMNLGLLEVNNDEIIEYANQSFCDVSGYDLEELIGRSPTDLFVKSKNNYDVIENQIELRKKGISSQFQMPIKNKRGELRWWIVSGAPNYDDQGNLLGSIGIHLDITEQKKLEEEYKKEKEKALEASKAKEAFLANMSHEIRTPLNAIIGFLRELSKQKLTDTQQKYIENSSNASQHLLSIINNILDISKIEGGEMPLEHKDFSIQDTINNVISILKPKVEQKNIKLYSILHKQIAPLFLGDAMKIEQILYNLIGNSMKFTQKGEIYVECNLLEDNPQYQKIVISVSDTGIGMNKEFINNIFRKFYQEDESIARRFGGTGLGMAITNELVKLMGGKINIESEKNKGTTIEVTLTLNKSTKENALKKKSQNKNLSVEGTRILLVEDNELNRMVAQNSLKNFKCIITEAENGIEAIKLIKKQDFDIILMDIQMPELDGIETTQIIREKYKLNTPIIALTANAFKTEIEKCKSVGMNDYITKPFTEERLLEVLFKNKTSTYVNHKTLNNTIPMEKRLYNLDSIKTLSRGDNEFIKKMIGIFITQTENIIHDVKAMFEDNRYEEISQLIHKIKPSIEGLGILDILPQVKQLEANAKKEQPNHQELKEQFLHIEDTLKNVIKQLKENEI